MATSSRPTPADARAALQELSDTRRQLAERVTSPGWYRLGAAACTASLFLGVGLLVGRRDVGSSAESASTLLVVFGAVLAPMALLAALKRSTGVSVERYGKGLGTWYVVVFGLFALGFVLQAFLDVPLALPVAGIGAFVATVLTERRIDELLRRRIHDDQDVRAGA